MEAASVPVYRITQKDDPLILVPYAKDGFRHVG
jgi:hypothetical protein